MQRKGPNHVRVWKSKEGAPCSCANITWLMKWWVYWAPGKGAEWWSILWSRSRALGKCTGCSIRETESCVRQQISQLTLAHGKRMHKNLKTAVCRSIDFEGCDACGTNWFWMIWCPCWLLLTLLAHWPSRMECIWRNRKTLRPRLVPPVPPNALWLHCSYSVVLFLFGNNCSFVD